MAVATTRWAILEGGRCDGTEEGGYPRRRRPRSGRRQRGHRPKRRRPKKKAAASTKPAPAAKKAPAKKTAAKKAAAKKAAPAKKAPAAQKKAAAKKAAAGQEPPLRPRRRRPRRSPTSSGTAPAPAPPKRPATGPYAKEAKFLDEQRALLLEERAVYQGQAVDLRAEADSLALEREPGDVQFDEESGEGGTVTVDRERNWPCRPRPGRRWRRSTTPAQDRPQDLRRLRALLPAHPESPTARPPVRPAVRGL